MHGVPHWGFPKGSRKVFPAEDSAWDTVLSHITELPLITGHSAITGLCHTRFALTVLTHITGLKGYPQGGPAWGHAWCTGLP